MKYRIILTGYTMKISVLTKLIWLWDVTATQIDLFQLRIWNRLKLCLTKLKQSKFEHIRDEIQKGGLDSWD